MDDQSVPGMRNDGNWSPNGVDNIQGMTPSGGARKAVQEPPLQHIG